VSVTEPAAGATVKPAFSVKVAAADERGLASITLSVDGQVVATRTTSPASFELDLAAGSHALRVDAKDAAGNTGTAEVSVSVAGPESVPAPGAPSPSPGSFGASCASSADCSSGLCAADTYTGSHYCTRACDLASPCPSSADCVPAGDTHVCALSAAPGPGNNADGAGTALLGGCSVARGPGAAALWPCALALLLLLGASLRRRRS